MIAFNPILLYRKETARRNFAIELAGLRLARLFPESSCFVTLTFHENIEDWAEANRRWILYRASLLIGFPHMSAVGIWARQKRGAWHQHMITSHSWSDSSHSKYRVKSGYGSRHDFSPLAGFTGLVTPASLHLSAVRRVRYLQSYMGNGRNVLDPSRDAGIRQLYYVGDSRVVWMRFSWCTGLGRLLKVGLYHKGIVDSSAQNGGQLVTMKEAEALIAFGFSCLPVRTQEFLVLHDKQINAWWNKAAGEVQFGGNVPF